MAATTAIRNRSTVGLALGAVVALGAALRVRQWLFARSFWLDEVYLLQEILARGPRELVGTFESSQSAPIAFLWMAEACEALLGTGELAMRVPSLLAGLALLVVVARLARLLLGPVAAVAATAVVATNERLVYYSVELKQYGVDALWSTLLVMLLVDVLRPGDRRWPLRAWTAAAVATPWMSHASIIVAGATGLVIAHRAFTERRRDLERVGVAGVATVASLGTVAALQLRGISGDAVLHAYWADAFAPRPWTWGFVTWLWDTWARFVDYAAPSAPAVVALAMVAAGTTHRRIVDARVAAVTALVGCGVVALAVLETYPPRDRLLLFALPLTVVLAAGGVERTATLRSVPRGIRVASVAVALAIAAPGVATGTWVFVDPLTTSETRDVVDEMSRLHEPGDVIVSSADGYVPLLHYGRQVGLAPDLIVLRSTDEPCPDAMAGLPGSGRVWLVFGYHSSKDPEPIETYGPWFDAVGDRRHTITAPLASAYLFEITRTPADVAPPPGVAWCVELIEAP